MKVAPFTRRQKLKRAKRMPQSLVETIFAFKPNYALLVAMLSGDDILDERVNNTKFPFWIREQRPVLNYDKSSNFLTTLLIWTFTSPSIIVTMVCIFSALISFMWTEIV